MTRYLTASKICLLALVSLYADSVVPTAATIPVLAFIVSYLLPPHDSTSENIPGGANGSFAITIEEFQKATITHASGIPGRTLWDLFLKKIWEINSLDALHVFFDSLNAILPRSTEDIQKDAESGAVLVGRPIRFSRTSPFGTFVRRAQLEFTRLQLHDSIALWKSFVVYRGSTMSVWRKRNPGAGRNPFDINLSRESLQGQEKLREVLYADLGAEDFGIGDVSTDDMEKLLEFQRDRIQSTGARLPKEIRDKLKDLMQSGAAVPSLSHYVKFLDAWKGGDYSSSFDNLHRFFDYTMHNRERTFYQYALLNLAILQKDFGCLTEAVAAINETIAAARENKDTGCLNYSLSWLYHLGKAYPEEVGNIQKSGVLGTDREALTFLKAKAKESGMWSLLNTSLLSEAKFGFTNGESVSSGLESIMKASHISVTKHLPGAVGSEMAMQSSLFARLGVSYVAWSLNELFLECYAGQSTSDDVLYAVCKRSAALALKGRYDQALVQMGAVNKDALGNLKHQQLLITHVCLIKLQRAIHRGNLDAAELFLIQLQATSPLDQEIAYKIMAFEIDLHIRRNDYAKAMVLLEYHALILQKEEADISQRIGFMIMKAHIYARAGIPQKGFSVAIRAASLAYKARLLPALWDAVGAICRVLISLKEFEAATQLMGSIMPQVLECEDCGLTAASFHSLADSSMGQAGKMVTGSIKRKEHMTKALEYLETSFDGYYQIEDFKGQCEVLAKKATILHLSGDLVLANDCASKYLAIQKLERDEDVA